MTEHETAASELEDRGMWFAVHVYATFKSSDVRQNPKILLEENIVLMNVKSKEDVFGRLDELKAMYSGATIYPGYEINNSIGIRKIVSVSNFDDGSNTIPPSDKSEVTYELYEFADETGANNFIEDKCVVANMESAIRRR